MKTTMARTIGTMRRVTTGMSSFKKLFDHQVHFQEHVSGAHECPGDNLSLFSYHIQAMVEELGEVMKSDKRWKSHRNDSYHRGEKLDELADVFITAMNIAIHSGFDSETMEAAINNKIRENFKRIGVEHDSNS